MDFIDFLESNSLLEKFKANLPPDVDYKKATILSAFRWGESLEGKEFWIKVYTDFKRATDHPR